MKTYNKNKQGTAIVGMLQDAFTQHKYYQLFLYDHDPENDPVDEPVMVFYEQDMTETSKAVFEVLEDNEICLKNKPLHGGYFDHINYNYISFKPLDDKYIIKYSIINGDDKEFDIAVFSFTDKNSGYTICLQFQNF